MAYSRGKLFCDFHFVLCSELLVHQGCYKATQHNNTHVKGGIVSGENFCKVRHESFKLRPTIFAVIVCHAYSLLKTPNGVLL